VETSWRSATEAVGLATVTVPETGWVAGKFETVTLPMAFDPAERPTVHVPDCVTAPPPPPLTIATGRGFADEVAVGVVPTRNSMTPDGWSLLLASG
jgi:hypothetical protein